MGASRQSTYQMPPGQFGREINQTELQELKQVQQLKAQVDLMKFLPVEPKLQTQQKYEEMLVGLMTHANSLEQILKLQNETHYAHQVLIPQTNFVRITEKDQGPQFPVDQVI